MTKKRTQRLVAGCAISFAVGMLGVAGCAPAPQESALADMALAVSADEQSVSGQIAIDSVYSKGDAYTPEVRLLDNGSYIQRTPSEIITPTEDASAYYQHPVESVPANTYYTNADEKGCNACHEDLGVLLENMQYDHFTLDNDMGLEVTLQACLDCHDVNGSSVQTNPGELGTLLHGKHQGKAACWNCHDASGNTDGSMTLWDLVKHDKLRGITDIADVDMAGEFNCRNDEVTSDNDLFNVMWQTSDLEYQRYDDIVNDAPRDDETFNSWTVTISGEVGEEKTWTLEELVAEAPSETFLVKADCTVNPTNGPLIGQVECTGIPMAWFFDQAGLTEDSANYACVDADGYSSYWGTVDRVTEEGATAYLVYEIGGERLTWETGFPCVHMTGGVAAYANTKQITDIVVTSGAVEGHYGDGYRFGLEFAKPTVGLFDLYEGQIVKVGEPFEFHGYADCFDERVIAIELSMDRGKTWKRFETPDSNTNNLLTWTYEFTPESETAYCLYLRGVSETGLVTEHHVEKMVVAKETMPGSEVE